MTSRVQKWLRGDLADVVQVAQRQRLRDVPRAEALDVRTGLERWSTQLTRRRAAVVARRYLLVALGIALVPAVVILAVGASRPFWVLAVLVLAPLAAAVALAQRTPDARAARLLDRALDLHDQLGTALELEARPSPSAGLARMVVNEASATLAQSFTTAHVRARRAPAEWAWLAVAVCGLVLVIAVPRHTAIHGGAGGGSALARAGPGAVGHGQGQSAAARSHANAASSSATTTTPTVRRIPLVNGNRAAYGVLSSSAPGSRPPATLGGSATVPGQQTKPGLTTSGATSAGQAQSAQTQSAQGQASAGAGGTTTDASGSSLAGHSGTSTTARASSGAVGAHAGVTSTTAGRVAGASPASKGRGTGGTPTAGTAGAGKAAPNAKLGLTPYGGAGTGKTGLPLQASYTPSGAGHVSTHEAFSQNNTGGGGGGGRSGHPAFGTAASGQSGTNFAVIPSTSNGSPSSEQNLLQNYFGSANQLSFKGW
jgi:hypothetical protein